MTKNKPLLVVDLDETILSCQEKPYREAQFSTEFGHLCARDGLIEFLNKVSKAYDLMIWSRNGTEYIESMLSHVWPRHIPLVDIFDQSHCGMAVSEGLGIPTFKDMKKVVKKHPQYAIERIIGIDDKPLAYKRNYGNLVQVYPFSGRPDTELDRLGDYLLTLAEHDDLRTVEKRQWRRTQAKVPDQAPSP